MSASDFRRQVVKDIQNSSSNSQTKVLLTALEQLSDEEIWQYGDRVCESLRRGGNIKEIKDQMRSQASNNNEYLALLQIMGVAESQLCPESSFPPAGLQRWLFYIWEGFNGGTPL